MADDDGSAPTTALPTTALPTTQRVLRLLDLIQRRTVWTGPELAAELGVTTRSVRRDVDRLRDLGYPVDAERGAGGGYRLGPGRRLPPLLLDDREAVAVAVALRQAAQTSVIGAGEHALAALAKIDQVMPARLREAVAAIVDSTVSVGGADGAVDPDLLLALGHCVRGSERARLEYRDRSGRESERRVEPYRIVVLGRRWYLHSFDLDRDDWRTFRLDRIGKVHRTGWRFTPRPDVPDPAEHVQRGVTSDQYDHRARVTVRAAAETVRAAFPPQFASVRPLRDPGHPDGPACSVETGGDDPVSLAWYLAALPGEFEVDGPDALVDALAALGSRLLDAAGRSGSGTGLG